MARYINKTLKDVIASIHRKNRSTGAPDKDTKKDKERKLTVQWKTEYSPRPHMSCDWNTVWHCGWSSCSSYKFQVSL